MVELENAINAENSSISNPLIQSKLSSSNLREYSESNNKEEPKLKSEALKSNIKLFECQEELSSSVKISDNIEVILLFNYRMKKILISII